MAREVEGASVFMNEYKAGERMDVLISESVMTP